MTDRFEGTDMSGWAYDPGRIVGRLGPKVRFGLDRARRVGRDLAALFAAWKSSGRLRDRSAKPSLLLVSDPAVAALGLAGRVMGGLGAAGFEARLFTALSSDPLAAEVDAAAREVHAADAAAVVGVGGGSALDVAKLAAVVASGAEPALHYALAKHPMPERSIAVVCLPTTAGTGSEMTRTSVFSAPDSAKLWAWGDALRSDLAVLDPLLTVDLPPNLTAATGLDALVHAIEAATGRRAGPETDEAALEAVRLVCAYLRRAVARPRDLESRSAMLLAAALAGAAIDRAGTAVAHALGHGLGSLAHVHHGRAVALGLRAALAWNAEAAPARHAAVALAFGLDGDDEMALAGGLTPAYEALLSEVGLDPSLGSDGLGPADADRLVAAVLQPENRPMLKANCREVSEADLRWLAGRLLT